MLRVCGLTMRYPNGKLALADFELNVEAGESVVVLGGNGSRGLYIHPNTWHGALMPLVDHAERLDRQGRVHARVSVDFAKEFGCYLAIPLRSPGV